METSTTKVFFVGVVREMTLISSFHQASPVVSRSTATLSTSFTALTHRARASSVSTRAKVQSCRTLFVLVAS
ncbi:MAG TPA: hypothetical protein VNA27_06955 [Rubrobacteraceae bacterium]|nr:hypothetical protein [Rubrobacteraceae bacterium]